MRGVPAKAHRFWYLGDPGEATCEMVTTIWLWPIATPPDQRARTTRCSRSVLYKADGQRIELPSDVGQQCQNKNSPERSAT